MPQLKKEFLLLYLEWLGRERLGLAPQVWAWGFMNHGGDNTQLHAEKIEAILTWLDADFAGETSVRGNPIARFVNDHELSDIYETYIASGGEPLPSPRSNVNDQFPYAADALADAGVTDELSGELGLPGVRLFELERSPPEGPVAPVPPRLYLLFREADGVAPIDLTGVLTERGVDTTALRLLSVVDGSAAAVDPSRIVLGPIPLVLEACIFCDGFESGQWSEWSAASP